MSSSHVLVGCSPTGKSGGKKAKGSVVSRTAGLALSHTPSEAKPQGIPGDGRQQNHRVIVLQQCQHLGQKISNYFELSYFMGEKNETELDSISYKCFQRGSQNSYMDSLVNSSVGAAHPQGRVPGKVRPAPHRISVLWEPRMPLGAPPARLCRRKDCLPALLGN